MTTRICIWRKVVAGNSSPATVISSVISFERVKCVYIYIYVYACTQSMYVYLLIRIQGGGGQRRLSAACSSLPLRFIRWIYREAGRLDSSFYEPIPSWDKQNGPILKVFFVSRERERKRERDMENGKTWRSV